jgi:superfamily II DNA helicase RecQ
MRDQVKKLHDLGVSAVSLLSGNESDEEAKALGRIREIFCIIWHSRVIVDDRTMETNA